MSEDDARGIAEALLRTRSELEDRINDACVDMEAYAANLRAASMLPYRIDGWSKWARKRARDLDALSLRLDALTTYDGPR